MPDDDLVIGQGGRYAVGTEELFSASARIRFAHEALAECLSELAAIDRLVSSGRLRAIDAPASAVSAERAMDDAAALLARARSRAGLLGAALDRSADAYGFSERAAQRLAQDAAAGLGYSLGFFLPMIAVHALPVVLGVGTAVATGLALVPARQRAALYYALSAWVQQHSDLLNDPRFVTFVRLALTSLDDVGAGLVHAPPDAARFLEAAGVGIDGVPASAALIAGVGGTFGYLRETPVVTRPVSSHEGFAPPTGWADRASRVPGEDAGGGAQVRIDRYAVPDDPDRFEVYIGGTRDLALGKDTEPWDMTSNVIGVAGGDPGSYRAVRDAMSQAGIDSSSPVTFTGHSQGGLIAAELAASGDYDTRGLYTLGAPASQVAVPDAVPWLAVEHTNDIVPALSGEWGPAEPLVVQRMLPEDVIDGADQFFPAHRLDAYASTGSMIDRTDEPRLVAFGEHFDDFTSGARPVVSTTYHAERVQPGGH